jgi:hypothetical protein
LTGTDETCTPAKATDLRLQQLPDVLSDGQRTQAKPHVLRFAAAVVNSNDRGVDGEVRRKAGRPTFYIANDWMTAGTEQANDPDVGGSSRNRSSTSCSHHSGLGCD